MEKLVVFDGIEFWERIDVSPLPYDQKPDFKALDAIANGFKWSMSVKGKRQRKFHCKSVMTNSIYAMLDIVKNELEQDCSAVVRVLTPDVSVDFIYC